jgi:NAD(P)-dependent dehydrogenase (short-subunit alcohol dehydrogenase family)
LVTAANCGVGLATANSLAQAGATVITWGSNTERNDPPAAREHRPTSAASQRSWTEDGSDYHFGDTFVLDGAYSIL